MVPVCKTNLKKWSMFNKITEMVPLAENIVVLNKLDPFLFLMHCLLLYEKCVEALQIREQKCMSG